MTPTIVFHEKPYNKITLCSIDNMKVVFGSVEYTNLILKTQINACTFLLGNYYILRCVILLKIRL